MQISVSCRGRPSPEAKLQRNILAEHTTCLGFLPNEISTTSDRYRYRYVSAINAEELQIGTLLGADSQREIGISISKRLCFGISADREWHREIALQN